MEDADRYMTALEAELARLQDTLARVRYLEAERKPAAPDALDAEIMVRVDLRLVDAIGGEAVARGVAHQLETIILERLGAEPAKVVL